MSVQFDKNSFTRLLRFMKSQARMLEISDSDKSLIYMYGQIIDFISENGNEILESAERYAQVDSSDQFLNKQFHKMLIEEVESFIGEKDVSRKMLEDLASLRFGVPLGSMRKWGSKEGLREKIRTMIRNERTHRTIKEVAQTENSTPKVDTSGNS